MVEKIEAWLANEQRKARENDIRAIRKEARDLLDKASKLFDQADALEAEMREEDSREL
jgi:hypothetical protein